MTARRSYLARQLGRMRRDEDGSALVEFGLLLPMMLLFFALAIEGGRTFWSYQTTIAGVRDAVRYAGRAAPSNICTEGGSLDGMTDKLTAIVRNASDGAALFPSSISVVSVTPSLTCISGTYRLNQTPVATVTASLQITYPFASVFGLFNIALPTANTSVTDSSRIFGA